MYRATSNIGNIQACKMRILFDKTCTCASALLNSVLYFFCITWRIFIILLSIMEKDITIRSLRFHYTDNRPSGGPAATVVTSDRGVWEPTIILMHGWGCDHTTLASVLLLSPDIALSMWIFKGSANLKSLVRYGGWRITPVPWRNSSRLSASGILCC